MFETSQQEVSSKAPKIIIVTIVVVLVIFGIFYLTHLSQEPASAPAAASGTQAATGGATGGGEKGDPMRDLQILKFNLGRDRQTRTMAMWDIQLANRSRSTAYKDIQYATNYYDANNNLLYQGGGTLKDQLDPMDQRTVTQINDGLYPVGTSRYTIELKGAQPAQ